MLVPRLFVQFQTVDISCSLVCEIEPFYNLAQTATYFSISLSQATISTNKMIDRLIDNSSLATSFRIARKFYPARNVVSENTNGKIKKRDHLC